MGSAVRRPIIGFHLDEHDDWVAELSCGHGQHVRHEPPWQVREWTESEKGRDGMVGERLADREADGTAGVR